MPFILRRRPSVWRLVVVLSALALGACDSGGGGGSDADAVQWSRMRRDSTNRAIGGTISNNTGARRVLIDLEPDEGTFYGATPSTPLIASDDTLYLGTQTGLLIRDPDGALRRFSSCVMGNVITEVGSISGTPVLTFDKDLIVANDAGLIFSIRDHGPRADPDIECRWTRSPSGTRILGSPLVLADAFDGTIASVFVTTGEGRLQAYNGDGSDQWRFPASGTVGSATSTAATDGVRLYFTAADRLLYALDTAGRLQWRYDVGATEDTDGLASPAAGPNIYATGTTDGISHLTAVSANGQQRWHYAADHRVVGSPAYILQTLEEPLPPTPRPTAIETAGGEPTPTPTPRMINVTDTVVYFVDEAATIYGIRDATGQPFDAVPNNDATPTPDGPTKPGKLALDIDPDLVATSPVLSSDQFVVFGTDGGYVYAVRLDFSRCHPCDTRCGQGCADSEWSDDVKDENGNLVGGRVDLFEDNPAARSRILSSPVIDRDGRIYVTTEDGVLHVIERP